MRSSNDSLSQREPAVVGWNVAMGKHPQALAVQQLLDEAPEIAAFHRDAAVAPGNPFATLRGLTLGRTGGVTLLPCYGA